MTGSRPAARPRLAVVAFGGNALLESTDRGTVSEQLERAESAAEWLTDLVRRGWSLLIVHGNGPQVGQAMIQMEAAVDKVPPGTLDLAVAETQGSMGYLLELALRNRFAREAIDAEPACLLSLVVVDASDPGFERPTKPVGPFFSAASAELFRRDYGWRMKREPQGWRKVVPSPRPLELLGLGSVRELLGRDRVVIAGGGGGIPVVRRGGRLEGIEAVIDKDRTASLLARQLEAELFLILTNVAHVKRDFGTDREADLPVLGLAEARALQAEGQFPPGSMGPKIEAAVDFVAATGRRVVITDIDHVHQALDGEAGTAIVPESELTHSDPLTTRP
ncbi:MAG TPA: carbamate kinase [Thermoanaerobaculia bacterium]|nr:carbamate kinase [Thermoanaerobaculia bacterium]